MLSMYIFILFYCHLRLILHLTAGYGGLLVLCLCLSVCTFKLVGPSLSEMSGICQICFRIGGRNSIILRRPFWRNLRCFVHLTFPKHTKTSLGYPVSVKSEANRRYRLYIIGNLMLDFGATSWMNTSLDFLPFFFPPSLAHIVEILQPNHPFCSYYNMSFCKSKSSHSITSTVDTCDNISVSIALKSRRELQ